MGHTEYTTRAQRQRRFIEAFKESGMILYACRKAGVARTTYYRWMLEDSTFINSVLDSFTEVYGDPSKKEALDELPKHKRHYMLACCLEV